jgi:hypothetical protein
VFAFLVVSAAKKWSVLSCACTEVMSHWLVILVVFSHRIVCVGFVMDRVALGKVFL